METQTGTSLLGPAAGRLAGRRSPGTGGQNRSRRPQTPGHRQPGWGTSQEKQNRRGGGEHQLAPTRAKSARLKWSSDRFTESLGWRHARLPKTHSTARIDGAQDAKKEVLVKSSMQLSIRPIPGLSWWRLARGFIRRCVGLRIADPDPYELSAETPAPKGSPTFARRRDNKGWRGGIRDDDAEVLRQMVGDHNIKALLEFGPGFSTYLFLSAGVERVVSCEHDPIWFTKARELFASDKRVTILPYENTPVVAVKLEGHIFDAAFVDSPKGNAKARVVLPGQEDFSRYNTLRAALIHAPLVFLHDARRPLEQATLARLAAEGLAEWDMFETTKGIARLRRL
jgi:hypothetical protein